MASFGGVARSARAAAFAHMEGTDIDARSVRAQASARMAKRGMCAFRVAARAFAPTGFTSIDASIAGARVFASTASAKTTARSVALKNLRKWSLPPVFSPHECTAHYQKNFSQEFLCLQPHHRRSSSSASTAAIHVCTSKWTLINARCPNRTTSGDRSGQKREQKNNSIDFGTHSCVPSCTASSKCVSASSASCDRGSASETFARRTGSESSVCARRWRFEAVCNHTTVVT